MSDAAEAPPLIKLADRRGMRRQWRIPPALRDDPKAPEPIEAIGILEDFTGEMGLLLWQTCRDVLLWSACEGARGELFTPGSLACRILRIDASGLQGRGRDAVRHVLELLRSPDQAIVDRSARMAARCREVADWAVAVGAPSTAVAFARAAAETRASDAAPALHVGRLTVSVGRVTMGRTWLRRAIALARRQGDWASYGAAHLELGFAALTAGNGAGARTMFIRAQRTARRAGLRVLRAKALHGRALVQLSDGELDAAEPHLLLAIRVLGEHPHVSRVRHDLAALLLRRGGESNSAALHLLTDLLPSRVEPGERIETLIMVVRAAAGAREPVVLKNTWFEAVALIDELGETAEAARRLMELARTTAEVLDTRRADDLARRAERIAYFSKAHGLAEDAAAFLSRARSSDRAAS